MINAIVSLNYLAVVVVAIVGFLIGWLWYSPVLFGKVWMAEMKITEESCKDKNMPLLFIRGFIYTLVTTFALAAVLSFEHSFSLVNGAKHGAFIGALIVGANMLNGGLWEGRTCKLQCINLSYLILVFAVQGAILGVWR